MIIHKAIGARVGLIGNPSDGFGGKTISSLISDFYASVILWESPKLEILPHPLFDPMSFSSIDDLAKTASLDGYYGGLRLLYAACKKFHEWCTTAGIRLERRNFTIQYDTTIPRQVGLAGSSAIVTATLKALMDFYGITDTDLPKPLQPNLVLAVETEELGISAGLQDRVVQVYGGLIYMDFADKYMATHGHGYYEPMDLSLLPPLYLAYSLQPSESGRIHSTVRYRFNNGDPVVVNGMRRLAELTDEFREALEAQDFEAMGRLMNENFDTRRRMYGDECIGATNLHMIELARSLGLPAKFPGSGGAIIGICLDEEQFARAQRAFVQEGFRFCRIHPAQEVSGNQPDIEEALERLHQLRLIARAGRPVEDMSTVMSAV